MNSFLKCNRGNVAMMFGIALVPLFTIAGIGLDLMRSTATRADLSQAVDAGLLAAARAKSTSPSLSDAELQKIARRVFDANSNDKATIDTFSVVYDPAAGNFTATMDARTDTILLKAVGIDTLDINVRSEAKLAPSRRLELALVLDNTDSMKGQKIEDLRSAALDLVNTVMPGVPGETYVSIVPFARHVRVSLDTEGASWLDVPPPSSYDANVCVTDQNASMAAGCSTQATTCTQDGLSVSCNKLQCPSGVSAVQSCSVVEIDQEWFGCLGSRPYPLNIEDRDYDTDPARGIVNNVSGNGDCPSELLPLSNSKTVVEDTLNALLARGNTYIPSGLSWGYRTLSPQEPYSEGKSYEDIKAQLGTKALILMTDGDNTASFSDSPNGNHYGNNTAEADTYTDELCTEIKSNDITVYTIAFQVTNSSTKTLLENCATNPSLYFDATNASALTDAFAEIAASLTELTLTR